MTWTEVMPTSTPRLGVLIPGWPRTSGRRPVPSVVTALTAKYTRPQDQQYLPDYDPDFNVVWAIRPRSAMAWLDDYAGSQRRWSPLW